MIKNLPVMKETPIQTLGQEDLLKKGTATHPSILAWRIPLREEPGELQFMGSQGVRHNWGTNTHIRVYIYKCICQGFSRSTSTKKPACQCRRCKICGFDPGVGKIPWKRAWQPTLVFLPGEFHGQRSLVGYSPWGHWVGHNWATSLSLWRIGEGNGNPLQCSCLENHRDGGAWWAAIYGVTQSRTQLNRLSSSSSIFRKWW